MRAIWNTKVYCFALLAFELISLWKISLWNKKPFLCIIYFLSQSKKGRSKLLLIQLNSIFKKQCILFSIWKMNMASEICVMFVFLRLPISILNSKFNKKSYTYSGSFSPFFVCRSSSAKLYNTWSLLTKFHYLI